MNVVRYEPAHMVRQFNDEVNRMFQHGEARARDGMPAARSAARAWAPAVDVTEEDERYVITADVPGVDPQDIEITMEEGVLSIKGTRSSESQEQGESYSRIERAHGEFERRFSLPEEADAEGIAATSNHGVLSVSIPKKPVSQPRRIAIQ